jgi:uncharacterized protein involved in exopolysaccharide biosynthesis
MQDSSASFPNDVNQTPNYLTVLIRSKALIIIGTLICLIVTAFASLFLPNVYEASAILLVAPPKLKTEFRPPVLNVQTYKQLLMNRDIIAKLLDKIRNEFPDEFQNVMTEDLFISLEVEIQKEGKAIGGADIYSPLLILKAQNKNREIAKRTVDIWMDLFTDLAKKLLSTQTEDMERLICKRFEDTEKNLREADRKLREFNNRANISLMQQRLGIKTSQLDTLLINLENVELELYKKKQEIVCVTQELLAISENGRCIIFPSVKVPESMDNLTAFQKEFRVDVLSKKAIYMKKHKEQLDFLDRYNIEYMKSASSNYRQEAMSYEQEFNSISYRMSNLKTKLQEVESQLASTPINLTFKKAPSSDLLLEFLKNKPGGAISREQLKEWYMVEEVLNPTHQFLQEEKTNLIIELNTLKQKETELEKEIKKNKDNLKKNNKLVNELIHEKYLLFLEYNDAKTEFERLEAIYVRLSTNQGELMLEINEYQSRFTYLTKKAELLKQVIVDLTSKISESLEKTRNLQRVVDRMENAHDKYKTKVEEAKYAKSEETSEIRIAARAVKPEKKIKPKRMFISIIAMVIGFFLSCMIAMFMDFLERNKDEI